MNPEALLQALSRPVRCSAVAALFAVILSMAATPSFAAHPLSIHIKTSHTSFKAGDQIKVSINFRNISDKPVAFSGACAPKGDVDGFRIEVTDGQGNSAPETNVLRWLRGEPGSKPPELTSGTSGPACGAVPPGGFENSGFVANRFYNLSKPGKYTIQVERTDSATNLAVRSNTITVTVTP